jgi:peroxiredoxin
MMFESIEGVAAKMLRMSRMMALGTAAPELRLPDTNGRELSLADVRGENGLVVAFICNHCPFVLHIIDDFVAKADRWLDQGVGVVAISSNEPSDYPEDAAEHMPAFARDHRFGFPYLYDEHQQVALAYEAICTPDFFLFDAGRRLFYAGQYDASRPKIDRPPVPGLPPLRTDLPVTGEDLDGAVETMLAGHSPPRKQRPSAGCSIKWRAEVEPSWA